jgi:S-adenosylmethionine:tRNA ribosyltransferase-isomerase
MEWIEVGCTIIKKNYHLKDLKDYQDICDSSNTTVGCVMTDPKNISLKDYTYNLPEERIASHPLAQRDASELLIYQRGVIEENTYSYIATYIPANSLLIFNDTKVIEARLLFQKPTGGVIEIFCLAPHEQYADITTAMMQKKKVLWQCLIGGASKWKHGLTLEKKINTGDKEIILHAIYIEKRSEYFIIELSWSPDNLSFAEVLHYAGAIPLPPYIKRDAEEADAERYQTIYAHYDGSVAAPTAGLHFTNDIFEKLKTKNIQKDFVTLHVGAGTFKPVIGETMREHEMHAEFIDVSKDTIKNVLQNLGNNIVAVGTTSLRSIESLYWLGLKTKLNPFLNLSSLNISQWEAYDLVEREITVEEALQSLLAWMKNNTQERLITKTQILIAPGYHTKIVKGLITNFHQPQSTLLLLVAAFIGEDWRRVYDYALKNNFRFLSYGDGSLLWRKDD